MSEKEEKVIIRKETKNLRRKYGRTKQINIIERDAFIPIKVEQQIREDILKKKTITPSELAVRYDVRVSTIKILLKQYEEEGLIKLLKPTLSIKIYVPAK